MRYVLVLIAMMGCGDSDNGIGASERGRLLAMRPVWIAAARAERCPRPALRTPITGDGSPRLQTLSDKSSPERKCLARVKELRDELGPCRPHEPCGPQTLATIKPHADVVEGCAPLYAAIEELAHASEACSLPQVSDSVDDEMWIAIYSLGNAVRLEVAPLVESGELGEAAERVLDAMRFADDLARKSTIMGESFATISMFRLVDTLDELATDPRLTVADARAIAHDLDMLLASAPRFDAIVRQEQAWHATFMASHDTVDEMVPRLAILEEQARDIGRVCCGTLRACVEHLDDVKVDGAMNFKEYAQRLALRDSALAFVRMQIELRLAPPEDCADPTRRRALLAPWADRAVVGNEREPVVTPLAWQLDPADPLRRAARVLRCVPAL